MLFFWNIHDHLTANGWANARQLADGAGIGYPAAWTIMLGGPIGRIDTGTLWKLSVAFGVEHDPFSLIEYRHR